LFLVNDTAVPEAQHVRTVTVNEIFDDIVVINSDVILVNECVLGGVSNLGGELLVDRELVAERFGFDIHDDHVPVVDDERELATRMNLKATNEMAKKQTKKTATNEERSDDALT